MKTKILLISVLFIVALLFTLPKENNNYSLSGLVSINVDGKRVDKYPASNKYKADVICNTQDQILPDLGTAQWNQEKKRWSIKFDDITNGNFACQVNFNKTTDPCEIPGYFCHELLKTNNKQVIKDEVETSLIISEKKTVRFANLTWYAYRINSDKSIRLILKDKARINDEEILIKYQDDCDNVTSIKDSVKCATYDLEETLNTKLEQWLKTHITGNNINYLSTNTFCNDVANNNLIDMTYFGSSYRNEVDASPSLRCQNHFETDNDKPNLIKNRIGLISKDEVNLINNNELFTSNSDTWTMSPNYYNVRDKSVNIYLINDNATTSSLKGIAPVIIINKHALVEGSGTEDDPYYLLGVQKP